MRAQLSLPSPSSPSASFVHTAHHFIGETTALLYIQTFAHVIFFAMNVLSLTSSLGKLILDPWVQFKRPSNPPSHSSPLDPKQLLQSLLPYNSDYLSLTYLPLLITHGCFHVCLLCLTQSSSRSRSGFIPLCITRGWHSVGTATSSETTHQLANE